MNTSGFERPHTATHDTKRSNLTSQQLKPTLVVDTATTAVLDLSVTTTRKHDTPIALQMVKWNATSIAVLTSQKGSADQKRRLLARAHEIRPLLK